MISAFIQLLCAMGQAQPEKDVIGELPTEVVANIMRYLDADSLVSAAGVNRRWKSVCQGDVVLRRKIRQLLHEQRKARIQAYFDSSEGIEVERTKPARVFGQRNGTVMVKVKPIKYEIPEAVVPQMKTFKIVKKSNNKVHPMDASRDMSKKKKKTTKNNNLQSCSIKKLRI